MSNKRIENYKKDDWKTAIGLLVGVGLIILTVNLYQNWRIKTYNETFGIYLGKIGGVGDASMYFKYKNFDNETIEASDKFSCTA